MTKFSVRRIGIGTGIFYGFKTILKQVFVDIQWALMNTEFSMC